MYIYTITSLEKHDIGHGLNRLIYVGSCIDYVRRFADHRSKCFNEKSRDYNHKVYRVIRQYGWDNFVFEVIEVCDDDITNKDLLFREQHYIDKYDSKKSMNSQDAITGLDMIEYQRLYNAEYYKKNKEKLIAQSKEWTKNNRDRFNETQRNYRKANAEKIAEYQETYRTKNRQRLNDLQNKKLLWKKSIAELCNITIYED